MGSLLILRAIYQFSEPLTVFKENVADHSGRDMLINCRIKLGCYPLKRLHDGINNSIKYGSGGIFGFSINKLLLAWIITIDKGIQPYLNFPQITFVEFSESSTRNTTYLVLDGVVKIRFLWLSLNEYVFIVVTGGLSGRSGGRERRAPPPPKISSFSCSFRDKLAK